jgi:hypothetical protein
MTPSGADGTFSVPVPDGTYEVEAAAEGYAATQAAQPVTVEGAPVGGLEVRLTAGATLAGRILGLNPDELAETTLTVDQGLTSRPAWLDDRDGSYSIEHLGPGDWRVTASYRGEQAVARQHLAPGEVRAMLDLTFSRGDLTLRGRLLGMDPHATYLAKLSLEEEEDSADDPRISTPDEHGDFQFTRLSAGHYRLRVQDLEFGQAGGGPPMRA